MEGVTAEIVSKPEVSNAQIINVEEPEGIVIDLDLSKHLDGSWPSSKNVSQ
jgi:hypothetical protein